MHEYLNDVTEVTKSHKRFASDGYFEIKEEEIIEYETV